jgi:AraC-like DNA-binding protein
MESKELEYNNYRISIPLEFEDVFTHFYFAKNDTKQRLTKTLIPNFQTIFIFSFGATVYLNTNQDNKIKIDNYLFLGPVKQAFDYTLDVGSEILVINFKDDAFYRFFGKVILNDHIPFNPDELVTENCFSVLWEKLKQIDNQTERVNFILDFCKPYLAIKNTKSELLINFKDTIFNPIKSVAQETQQSERNIQLHHKKYFGYSAKEINRYNRFLKAVELIQNTITSAAKVEWFDIVDQCGYYDQSQLIHDFKHFINLTPSQFQKFQQDICNPKL